MNAHQSFMPILDIFGKDKYLPLLPPETSAKLKSMKPSNSRKVLMINNRDPMIRAHSFLNLNNWKP